MHKLLALTAALALSACASGTPLQETAKANAAVPADKGRIIVYRTGLYGAAIQPKVSVDRIERGRCAPRGAFSVDVAPGDHTVAATTETRKESLVHVGAGQTAYLRCGIGFGILIGRPTLEAVPPATGKKESAKLAYTGKY